MWNNCSRTRGDGTSEDGKWVIVFETEDSTPLYYEQWNKTASCPQMSLYYLFLFSMTASRSRLFWMDFWSTSQRLSASCWGKYEACTCSCTRISSMERQVLAPLSQSIIFHFCGPSHSGSAHDLVLFPWTASCQNKKQSTEENLKESCVTSPKKVGVRKCFLYCWLLSSEKLQ